MMLGSLKIKNPYLFAPMDMYSDSAFRQLCSDYCCSYSFTQLIPTPGFIRKPLSLKKKIDLKIKGGIQFISNSPSELKEAIRIVNDCEFYNDIENVKSIDLNLGCPSKRMMDVNMGSALLDQHKLIKELFAVMRKHSKLPISAKIRLALNEKHKLSKPYLKIAKMAKEEGLDFITVHGRTAVQMYEGSVDVSAIKETADKVDIPIIGNGNITDEKTADEMLSFCKAVMIGRHALKEPFVFRKLSDRKWNFDYENEKRRCIVSYIKYAEKYNETAHCIKLHIQAMLKGMNSKQLITKLNSAKSVEEIRKIMQHL